MQFYTYLWLREDGTPYYVGKGKEKRAIRKGSPTNLDNIIIQPFESETDALVAEMFLISYYGRKDLGVGILRNLTDGGEGKSNPCNPVRYWLGKHRVITPEHAAKISASMQGRMPKHIPKWTKGKKRGPSPFKIYANGAEKVRAYRERQKAKLCTSIPY